MIERKYYEAWNKNDTYEIRQEVLGLLDEIEKFDVELKKFLGPTKVKKSSIRARKCCRNMEEKIKTIKDKIQLKRHEYDSDYEND